MEDEILSFLKNPPVEMKQEQALCKVLRDDQDCKSVEEVVKQTEKDWEDLLKKVELKTATKVRLFNAIKNISKKSNIPIPENKEVVLVFKIKKKVSTAYVTLKVHVYCKERYRDFLKKSMWCNRAT
ncbi:hypothetical protein RFI_26216 [Reticulomyxa filosa]|uniref:Uncharacterized protein n=1 Tax=Reticulomyxa filosa TaxID=46433 RepID=X6MCI5_RETFI|nr:hypothetical protein RFI_26216 [Reticulomyxa filosa]|eukprot:ETO11162.1 hypothetical protein RFI_26216 [Reticulomyxa filosa]